MVVRAMLRSFSPLMVFLALGCGAAHRSLPAPSPPQVTPTTATATTPDDSRKIIYEASLSVLVPDLSKVEPEIIGLVKGYQGYVAHADLDRTQGTPTAGSWTVRVPVDRFDEFLKTVSSWGIVERFNQKTLEVTAEYVDLEARLSNLRQLEQRIVRLLEKQPDDLPRMLEVERELSRVRGQVEQMEGQRRLLDHRLEFTTVVLRVFERKEYVPPEAPTFPQRITAAWNTSWARLLIVAEVGLTAIVVVVPWAGVSLPVGGVVYAVLRQRRRPRQTIPARTS